MHHRSSTWATHCRDMPVYMQQLSGHTKSIAEASYILPHTPFPLSKLLPTRLRHLWLHTQFCTSLLWRIPPRYLEWPQSTQVRTCIYGPKYRFLLHATVILSLELENPKCNVMYIFETSQRRDKCRHTLRRLGLFTGLIQNQVSNIIVRPGL